jgi:hypothetical protein
MKRAFLSIVIAIAFCLNCKAGGDTYYSGDWDGDGRDNIAVRRGGTFYFDFNFDGVNDGIQSYGNGELMIDGKVDKYIIGDWDGDGRDNVGVVRGNQILLDINYDGAADIIFAYGNGPSEDEYLVGKWNGGKIDHIAVRRGGGILMDFNNDGTADKTAGYGNGNADKYLIGDWNASGTDHFAVRRGNSILMNFEFDGGHNFAQGYGNGDSEDAYLVGDWDGDGKDNLAVLRGNLILMDTNFDGVADKQQAYGNGMTKVEEGNGWFGDILNGLAKGVGAIIDGMNNQSVYQNLPNVSSPNGYKKCGDRYYDPKTQVCCYCQSRQEHSVYTRQRDDDTEYYECDTWHRAGCPQK